MTHLQSDHTNKHYYLYDYKEHKNLIIGIKYRLDLYQTNLIKKLISNELPSRLYENYPMVEKWSVTPIPLHWRSRLRRRFSLNTIISKKIAKDLNLDYLNCISNVSSITQGDCKSRKARISNAKDKFKTRWNRKKIINQNIILFDDVVATGATMQACEKLLKKNGAKTIVWLSIAH